ncbi:unknown [Bacteroides sp. CAG:702]|nr:unknown [Bacteroides sp. CAG:702]
MHAYICVRMCNMAYAFINLYGISFWLLFSIKINLIQQYAFVYRMYRQSV